MRSLHRPAAHGAAAPTLVVWLPGAFQCAQDFIDAGFESAVRSRELPIDLEFVDLESQHLGDRSVLEELQRDVVAPARARGCRSIWLAGISLGGFTALAYAELYQEAWDGLCLLAPYLGNRTLIAEIAGAARAGASALSDWQPGALVESDEERRLWRFIQALPATARPVYLGYGSEDRFAAAHGLMAGHCRLGRWTASRAGTTGRPG